MNDNINSFMPIVVTDIDMWPLFETVSTSYCLGSIEKDRYIKIGKKSEALLLLCKKMNGNHTLQELQDYCHNEKIDANVCDLFRLLERSGLVENGDLEKVEKQEMDKLSYSVFTLSLDRIYSLLRVIGRIMFPLGIILFTIVILMSLFLAVINISLFFDPRSYAVNDSLTLGTIITMISSVFFLLSHELSHAVASMHMGLKPKTITLSLYLYSTLMVYLRIPGIYRLPARKRIIVWGAGMYTNLFLFSALFLAYIYTGLRHQSLFVLAVSNLFQIMRDMSPFMPLDGYYIISTLLKRPNLRKNSFVRGAKKDVVQILYFLISGAFMIGVVGSQIVWVIRAVYDAIVTSSTIIEFVKGIDFIIFIILIFLASKLFAFWRKRRDGRSNND